MVAQRVRCGRYLPSGVVADRAGAVCAVGVTGRQRLGTLRPVALDARLLLRQRMGWRGELCGHSVADRTSCIRALAVVGGQGGDLAIAVAGSALSPIAGDRMRDGGHGHGRNGMADGARLIGPLAVRSWQQGDGVGSSAVAL